MTFTYGLVSLEYVRLAPLHPFIVTIDTLRAATFELPKSLLVENFFDLEKQ